MLHQSISKRFEVTSDHSAASVGSGGLDVLSTPSLIAFMEQTAYQFIQADLPDTETTVGYEIMTKHLAPSLIGQAVTIHCQLVEQNNNRYSFQLEAYVANQKIATASHKRARVVIDQFLNKR